VDPDLDPDASFQVTAQTHEKVLKQAYIPDPAYHFDADPDFYLIRIRMQIQVTKMMQILADPDQDPEHFCNHAQTAYD
jgi:hypothetical protein